MHVEVPQLRAFILDSGVTTEEKFKKAEAKAKKTGKQLNDILVEDKLVTKDELARLKAYILGIPFINLKDESVPKEILQIIPEPIARKHNIVAFRKKDKDLEVAMLDPEDLQTIDFIKKKASLKILPRLTNEESITNILMQYQRSLEAEFGDLIKEEAGIVQVKEGAKDESDEDLAKAAEEMPVIKIVDTLLKHAILQQASDIHIEPMEKEVVVRYRIDGILHDTMTLPRKIHSSLVARIKVLSNLKLDEHRLPQDGRFKIETDDYKISFRVSILPVYDGEKIVMRLLPEKSKGLTLEGLGFTGEALEQVHQSIKRPHGLILATGPTGSGKTTTLYTIMDIINTPDVNISTVEDPIEYRMTRVNQTQVKPKIGLTFSNGLRSLLRQDPDIIMVGEIRDNETAALAINASLTGHLVLSTLHTNNASGSLPRLIDMEAEPFLIASTINLIIAQRLVRRLCTSGRKKYKLKADQLKSLNKQLDMDRILKILKQEKAVDQKSDWSDIDFYQPGKSQESVDGYKSRIGIHEVLKIDEEIKDMIVKNATADQIEQKAKEQGMITMLEDGFVKAVQGITSIEEVLRVTRD